MLAQLRAGRCADREAAHARFAQAVDGIGAARAPLEPSKRVFDCRDHFPGAALEHADQQMGTGIAHLIDHKL